MIAIVAATTRKGWTFKLFTALSNGLKNGRGLQSHAANRNRTVRAMNAMTPGENRNAGNGRDVADEKMDQIRDLLFGEFQREHDQRTSQLEARIRDLDTEVHRRLDALQARLDAYAGESQVERRSTFDELARGIQALGEHVRRIPRE